MNTAHTVIVFLTAISLTACSGPPSEFDGRSALSQKITENSDGLIRLVSFGKTNGVVLESGTLYQLEYTAEIEFLDDCIWSYPSFSATRGRPENAFAGEMLRYEGRQARQKGERLQASGKLIFRKTENGWKLQ